MRGDLGFDVGESFQDPCECGIRTCGNHNDDGLYAIICIAGSVPCFLEDRECSSVDGASGCSHSQAWCCGGHEGGGRISLSRGLSVLGLPFSGAAACLMSLVLTVWTYVWCACGEGLLTCCVGDSLLLDVAFKGLEVECVCCEDLGSVFCGLAVLGPCLRGCV